MDKHIRTWNSTLQILVANGVIPPELGANARVYIHDLLEENPNITLDELKASVAVFMRLNKEAVEGYRMGLYTKDVEKIEVYVPST